MEVIQIDQDGAFVRFGNGVVRSFPGRGVSTKTPPCPDFGAGWYIDDGVVFVLYSSVASEVLVVDVLDRTCRIWGANAFQLALIGTIN